MLIARIPNVMDQLQCCDTQGRTPLYLACIPSGQTIALVEALFRALKPPQAPSSSPISPSLGVAGGTSGGAAAAGGVGTLAAAAALDDDQRSRIAQLLVQRDHTKDGMTPLHVLCACPGTVLGLPEWAAGEVARLVPSTQQTPGAPETAEARSVRKVPKQVVRKRQREGMGSLCNEHHKDAQPLCWLMSPALSVFSFLPLCLASCCLPSTCSAPPSTPKMHAKRRSLWHASSSSSRYAAHALCRRRRASLWPTRREQWPQQRALSQALNLVWLRRRLQAAEPVRVRRMCVSTLSQAVGEHRHDSSRQPASTYSLTLHTTYTLLGVMRRGMGELWHDRACLLTCAEHS